METGKLPYANRVSHCELSSGILLPKDTISGQTSNELLKDKHQTPFPVNLKYKLKKICLN